jgi:hypothetical protein
MSILRPLIVATVLTLSTACQTSRPVQTITEIVIERPPSLGYYLPAGAPQGRPFYWFGHGAGYTLLLRANGSAIYTGSAQLPVIGIRRTLAKKRTLRFAPRGLALIGTTWSRKQFPRANSFARFRAVRFRHANAMSLLDSAGLALAPSNSAQERTSARRTGRLSCVSSERAEPLSSERWAAAT